MGGVGFVEFRQLIPFLTFFVVSEKPLIPCAGPYIAVAVLHDAFHRTVGNQASLVLVVPQLHGVGPAVIDIQSAVGAYPGFAVLAAEEAVHHPAVGEFLRTVGLERHGPLVDMVDAIFRANPDASCMVVGQAFDLFATDFGTQTDISHLVAVVAVEPVEGSDPDEALVVLNHRVGLVAWKSVVGVKAVEGEILLC